MGILDKYIEKKAFFENTRNPAIPAIPAIFRVEESEEYLQIFPENPDQKKSNLLDATTSMLENPEWPFLGDELFQFLSINENDWFERLLQNGDHEGAIILLESAYQWVLKNEQLYPVPETVLRKAYQWVQNNKNFYTDVETVLKNVQLVAEWIKKFRKE